MARRLLPDLGIRSTLFDRRQFGQLPTTLQDVEEGEAGASSDSWYLEVQGGGPDVNPELSGSAKFPVFDEMAATDPTIKSLLALWSLPAGSAVWGLEPADEAERFTIAVRDLVAWNVGLDGRMGEMELSWAGGIRRTITTGLKHGPAIEELVWDDVRDYRDADGDVHLVRPLARLAPRPAGTIERVHRRNGRLEKIEQNIAGARPMKAAKVSYVVFDPDETGRWEGSSMIRPAWVAWRMKKALQIAAGIGWDRFASGLPVVYHPNDPDSEARAKRIGRAIRQHERAFVNFPAEALGVSGTGRPQSEWFLDLVNGAATLADPVPLLRWFAEEEVEAGLANWSRLGRTESGSRAVGEVQIDPFFLGVQAVTHELARERERQVLRRIVAVNFGEDVAEWATPKLTVSRIQARNVEVVARAISYLSPAGITFTDRGAVNDLRELLGFGELDEAAEVAGVSPADLTRALRSAGLDEATLASVLADLPPELGLQRNRVEGGGLLPA